jgi:hypothetical protein
MQSLVTHLSASGRIFRWRLPLIGFLLVPLPLLMGASQQLPIVAENWVEYYRTGSGPESNIEWDLNQIDVNSVRRAGDAVRYRVRVLFSDGKIGEYGEMQADCAKRERGQFPDLRMRSVYEGTLGGAEVKAACSIARGGRL